MRCCWLLVWVVAACGAPSAAVTDVADAQGTADTPGVAADDTTTPGAGADLTVAPDSADDAFELAEVGGDDVGAPSDDVPASPEDTRAPLDAEEPAGEVDTPPPDAGPPADAEPPPEDVEPPLEDVEPPPEEVEPPPEDVEPPPEDVEPPPEDVEPPPEDVEPPPEDVEPPPEDVEAPLEDVEPPLEDVEPPPEDVEPPPEDLGPVGPLPCDPPLVLTPEATAALPYDLLVFKASGGTGKYRFALESDQSGGIVNALTGAYLSGGSVGVVDVIVLTDLGCEGTGASLVNVVDPPQVLPGAATVPPGADVAFEVLGGSGVVSFELVGPANGAMLAPDGAFVAGSAGKVTVRARDLVLELALDAKITVVDGAVLVGDPRQLALPAGSTFVPRVVGGSGVFDFAPAPGSEALLSVSEGAITAAAAGQGALAVTDRYTSLTTQIPVVVASSLAVSLPRAGDGSAHAAVAAGDIDGDGLADAVLGLREADVDALDGGAAYVYRGLPVAAGGGLEASPLRVITGARRRDFVGQAVLLRDFDGDGLLDLAVSGYQLDVAGLVNNGGVWVFRGVPGAFFEDAPSTVLAGPFGSDEFGFAMDAGDVNGDGELDLVVSARLGEDRKATPQRSNQGALHVFLGRPGGFIEDADTIVYGMTATPTGPAGEADLQMGNAVAVGDFDKNGADDVAWGSLKWGAAAGRTNDGLIAIHAGVLADAMLVGGLTELPVRFLGGIDAVDKGTNLGRTLAAGDLDGDDAAELVASQYLRGVTGKIQVGAVRIWSQTTLPTTPPLITDPAESATRTIEGAVASDQTGWWVAVADWDGVAPRDLVVGDFQLEVPGGPANAGTLRIFRGVVGGAPQLARTVGGLAGTDRFGQAATIAGDLDGDGVRDALVFAGQNDDLGPNVGRPYYARGAAVPEKPDAVPLAMPGEASGANVGRGLAFVPDLNGDGKPELFVGIPNGETDANINSGLATVYSSASTSPYSGAPTVLANFTGHSGSDQLGWAAAGGDFDGDGHNDLAVLARADDRPNNFETNAAYLRDGTCTGATTNSGVVFVFRGTGAGVETKPAFAYYPPQDNVTPDSLDGGFDMDGDGKDELVLGSVSWDPPKEANAGAALIIRGRASTAPTKITVICDAWLTVQGLLASDALGRSVSGVPDLDGDGCDEVAIGANAEDFGQSNQGTVRLIWGYGKPGCPSEPLVTLLAPGVAGAQSGFSVDSGGDLDGDGLADLGVGAFQLSVSGNTVGGAWMVRGSWLATLAASRLPLLQAQTPTPFGPVGALANLRVEGGSPGDELGRSVALVPGVLPGGRAALLVGGPLGGGGGTPFAGGARLVEFVGNGSQAGDGLKALPLWALGGETERPEGRIGETVVGATFPDGTVWLAVSGYEGQGSGLDQGSVFVVPLLAP